MKICKYCHTETGYHYCDRLENYENANDQGSPSGDPLLSAAVAAVTDSSLLGIAVGGSITGAILGDLFGDGDIFD